LHAVNHSPPSNAEVKEREGLYLLSPNATPLYNVLRREYEISFSIMLVLQHDLKAYKKLNANGIRRKTRSS
jgi:hypothetical protein